MSISRTELLHSLDALLQPERFKDYGPNGLQVEGKPHIGKLVSGVTASRALIDAAIQVHAWCLHRENAASPAAMPDQGDITVPYACALGGSMVLPWCAATVGQPNIKVS